MLTDNELKKRVDILTNKLKAGLFQEVIDGAKLLLKKRKHQVLFKSHKIIHHFLKSMTHFI